MRHRHTSSEEVSGPCRDNLFPSLLFINSISKHEQKTYLSNLCKGSLRISGDEQLVGVFQVGHLHVNTEPGDGSLRAETPFQLLWKNMRKSSYDFSIRFTPTAIQLLATSPSRKSRFSERQRP